MKEKKHRAGNGRTVYSRFPIGIAIIGILALATSLGRAEHITERITFNLTALVPGETIEITRGSGDDEEVIGSKTLRPERLKVNNKALLQLLGAPAGSKLVLIERETNLEIGIQQGTDEPEGTGYFISDSEPDLEITQGQETNVDSSTETRRRITKKSRYSSQFVTTISVAGADLEFSITGLATSNDVESSVETDDSIRSRDSVSFSISGAGTGSFRDDAARPASGDVASASGEESTVDVLISGRISASGNGSFTESTD